MILVIDNYDSFTYNLVQYLGEVDPLAREIKVFRNNVITVDEIASICPTHIVISPGPCTPNESGISIEVVKQFYEQIPILGVCLGHQVIGQAFGATIKRAPILMHGKTSIIHHNRNGIFSNISQDFIATRYHSLVVEKTSLPKELIATAYSEDNEIMALEHRSYPTLIGLQFHPESILTGVGKKLLLQFLNCK